MFYKNLDKKTLSAGLVLSAIGFMFVPAATMESFPFFLTALRRIRVFNSANCC
jgi:fucose permease